MPGKNRVFFSVIFGHSYFVRNQSVKNILVKNDKSLIGKLFCSNRRKIINLIASSFLFFSVRWTNLGQNFVWVKNSDQQVLEKILEVRLFKVILHTTYSFTVDSNFKMFFKGNFPL